MRIESKHSRTAILACIKNNLNKTGFSIVWVQAEGMDRYYIYIFEGFLNQEKADLIQEKIIEDKEMLDECVCMIRLTHGTPYHYAFKPGYDAPKMQRLNMAIIDAFEYNSYMFNEAKKVDFGGAKITIDLKELIALPKYKDPEIQPNQTQA